VELVCPLILLQGQGRNNPTNGNFLFLIKYEIEKPENENENENETLVSQRTLSEVQCCIVGGREGVRDCHYIACK
jgi:hypothetical protein